MWYRIGIGLLLICEIAVAQKTQPVYKNPGYTPEERTKDLLQRMTLDEKVGQILCFMGWEMYAIKGNDVVASDQFKTLEKEQSAGMLWAAFRADPWTKKTLENGLNPELAAKAANALQRYSIENSRLGIPMFFAEEAAHGHMAIGTTVFPTGLGQAATFNPGLIEEMGKVIGEELRLQGAHIAYGPILDLAREPRWSRVEETYGEDPVLVARTGEAMVKGLGGGDVSRPGSAISTLKHFIAYGGPESGVNGNASVVSRRDLLENYFPPFQAAIKAGALSVMTSYNSIDGIPSTMNKEYLTDILRHQWNFRGFSVSDLYSIQGIMGSHFVTKTVQEAAIKSVEAGTNVDLGGTAYAELREAVQEGKLHESVIDSAAYNVLRWKFAMGLFDNPYVDPQEAREKVHSKANIALARELAQQSTVLLENKGVLPLNKKGVRVAVVGPNANVMYNQLGDYTSPQPAANVVTVLEGIQAKVGAKNVVYAKGCAIRDTTQSDIASAVKAAQSADVAVVVVGGSSARDFNTDFQATGAVVANSKLLTDMESGEGNDRLSLGLMGDQLKLLQAIKQTGKPMVVIYIEGRPLNMNWASENADALLTAWYPGEQGGNGIADVLFGDYNPTGRLPISVPRSVGQLPVFYDKKNPKAHDYVEGTSAPLYAFGEGKSYTTFQYADLKIEPVDDFTCTVSFDLTNTGRFDGAEVPQLYLRDEYASTVRPIKQLQQFAHVYLKKGETKQVSFTLTKDMFSLIGVDYKRVIEAGDFNVMIGSSSKDVQLEGTITLEKGYQY
jgi:beta-glucosidase